MNTNKVSEENIRKDIVGIILFVGDTPIFLIKLNNDNNSHSPFNKFWISFSFSLEPKTYILFGLIF